MIPGFLNLELNATQALIVRAGGALAVFTIVFFYNPAKLLVHEDRTLPPIPSPATLPSGAPFAVELTQVQTGFAAPVEADFVEQARLFDTGVADTIPVGESREVLALIRRPDSPGLVESLRPGEESPFGSATAYSVYRKDVRTIPFTAFFRNSREPLRVRVELRAPSLEISDSPMTIRISEAADTGVLSFLVLSKDTGTQTLKVRIVCDDEELVSNLLRTRFVHHGGLDPSGPGMGMRFETDEEGKHMIVLAESELLIRFAAKTYQVRQAQA